MNYLIHALVSVYYLLDMASTSLIATRILLELYVKKSSKLIKKSKHTWF